MPPTGQTSLQLNGTSGVAEVLPTAALDLPDDWTIEPWFKDESPLGFNHDYVSLLNKGDREANPASPYVVNIGYKALQVGYRTNWVDSTLRYDLRAHDIDPTQWHHLAATFTRSTRTLVLYVDGVFATSGKLTGGNPRNSLPLQVGRNGPVSGRYFQGKLDDIRIWRVARTVADIKSTMNHELTPRHLTS